MKFLFIGRALLVGALIGASFYFMPFLFFPLRFIAGLLFVGFLLKLLFAGGGPPWRHHRMGYGRGRFGPGRMDFFDRVRGMSEEEYTQFRTNMQGRCGHHFAEARVQTPTPEATV